MFIAEEERIADKGVGTLPMSGQQRVVLREIARRTDLAAPDPAPEPARQRNVTMIPRGGGRVVVQRKLPA